jgi:hypothetical protein
MYTETLNPQSKNDISRLRNGVDPKSVWFTDEELTHIIRVSGCILDKAVVRCFLGIQQKCRQKNPRDKDNLLKAKTQLNYFESGFLKV